MESADGLRPTDQQQGHVRSVESKGQIATRRRWPVSFSAPTSRWIMLTVERVTHGAERVSKAGGTHPLAEGPGGELTRLK